MTMIISLALVAAGILCLCRAIWIRDFPIYGREREARVLAVLGLLLVACGAIGSILACVRLLPA